MDGVTGLRAGVGIAAERLEAITESQRSAILYLDEIVAGIEDTDLAAVLTRIASDQAASKPATPSPASSRRSRWRTTCVDVLGR